jgi:hypothetical protein
MSSSKAEPEVVDLTGLEEEVAAPAVGEAEASVSAAPAASQDAQKYSDAPGIVNEPEEGGLPPAKRARPAAPSVSPRPPPPCRCQQPEQPARRGRCCTAS